VQLPVEGQSDAIFAKKPLLSTNMYLTEKIGRTLLGLLPLLKQED